jgi:hypothetical protein
MNAGNVTADLLPVYSKGTRTYSRSLLVDIDYEVDQEVRSQLMNTRGHVTPS